MGELDKSREIIQRIINSIIGKKSNPNKELDGLILIPSPIDPTKTEDYYEYNINRINSSKFIIPFTDSFGNQYLLEI